MRLAATLLLIATASCGSIDAPLGGAGAASAPSGTPAAASAGAGAGSVIERPGSGIVHGDVPVALGAKASAGTFVLPYAGRWRYEGASGTLAPLALGSPAPEHPAPRGGLVAVERRTRTPGGTLLASELAVRETSGIERVVYRAAHGFYWNGWSPDGRYLLLWEIDRIFSGSIDLDGRPLVLVDATSGAEVGLGRTLLNATTAWTAPHTLAYVAGGGRMVWDEKTLRLWSPELGARDVTSPDVAPLAPAWSADGARLYFISGPAGTYDPVAFFAGRAVGDRSVTVYDVAARTMARLPHAPGYVEEGVRPSRDAARLLVLRRALATAVDARALSIAQAPLEAWITDARGANGTALVRVANAGFGYYGWYPGPADWEWSE